MKHIVIAFLLLTTFVNAQTTETEVNYLTKGLKIQLESGLDMKKGYTIKDVDSWGVDFGEFNRNAIFKQLYRDGETSPCATVMIFERDDIDYKDYICIPHYKSEKKIWDKSFGVYKTVTEDWTSASRGYVWGMLKMISYMTSELN